MIPVNNIVRQLTQADVTNPSQTLANLATYYSVGAQSAISAQDIQNYNPGVQSLWERSSIFRRSITSSRRLPLRAPLPAIRLALWPHTMACHSTPRLSTQ